MRHNEEGLFSALEKILRASGEPMDCPMLVKSFPALKTGLLHCVRSEERRVGKEC